MSKQAVKATTTHVVLNDRRDPGKYVVWSEHKSDSAALKTCNAIGKNAVQGHTVVVPVAELGKWSLV